MIFTKNIKCDIHIKESLFVSECNTLVELIAKETNVDNIYNIIT